MSGTRIAVIGSGPRGMMVLERLVARLAEQQDTTDPLDVRIFLVDAVEPGAGQVYRTDQPDWFLMNTVAGQISAYSGLPDGGPVQAGAGPSFAEWWESADAAGYPGPDSYAPRAQYGRYLRSVLAAIQASLPPGVRLRCIKERVEDVVGGAGRYRLTLSGGERLDVDRVVLTTGHASNELTGREGDLADFAVRHPGLRYIQGGSAADMPLDDIPAGSRVGVIGLGLSFYDVMAALTLGRGGTFTERADGTLRYVPSGSEPVIVAGSRSGMPLHARGHNQKPPTYSYHPVLFTLDRVRAHRPWGPLDFAEDVYPWLKAEIDLVYYGTALRRALGTDAAERFAAQVTKAAEHGVPQVAETARQFGLRDQPPLDLDTLARPFEQGAFTGPAEFGRVLRKEIEQDLAAAAEGNVDSPLKAALDVMRDTRWVIRELVDFSGLTARSQRDDFLGWYVPRASFLAAGPPSVRLRQVLALLDSGHLHIVGPHTRYDTDAATGRYTVSSPRVDGSALSVTTLVDARVPDPDLRRNTQPLTARLRERGVWTSYVNRKGAHRAEAHEVYDTGGVAVTQSPFHPVDREGRADEGMYVLGIPTEHTRWFMQVGSSRPGMWSDFVRDADRIAEHALEARPAGLAVRDAGDRPVERKAG
ncbi:FAD/NAD(P)-binding protein [Streptomyces sp. ME02-8801-2C]|uniref:FAD/NAD(P)-binding protein n=1 Tax=Streptomyces sp. ME02-8801-2C TaxID=3028680 RepID=UPI0029B89D32|nr:FAD/NAD(P)-binding protein [Streptomyces sp. ME02-8801-2C]MDX3455871.1 FAD/NAD(P)-binding protein [Streptomyces sp. ME02-8801-2C]